MNNTMAAEIDISAILDTYVYMDEQNSKYQNKTLRELLDLLPDPDKSTQEYKQQYEIIYNAVKAEGSTLGDLKLISQSMNEGINRDLAIACAFEDPENGNVYVAYRGTGDGKWVDNGVGLTEKSTVMQDEALEYFDHVIENDIKTNGKIIVTGHSKGGNEAQYVTLKSKYGYMIDNCYSIDGQGFSKAAVESFKERGEDYYYDQLSKMYSINGENDYVHDLGIRVIPDENTYFIETGAESFAGYHSIHNMIEGDGLKWTVEGGIIVHGEQGPAGQFAKALSEKMMQLNDEDLRDCAVTVMSLIERFMPYDGESGSGYHIGTGDVKFMTEEELFGFLATGVPLILDTLLTTPEGRETLSALIGTGVEKLADKYGPEGVAFTFLLISALLPKILDTAVMVWLVSRAYELATDIVDRIKQINENIKKWLSDVMNALVEIVNKIKEKKFHSTAGYRYATDNPQVSLDTDKLKTYSERIDSVNSRIDNLDKSMDALYLKIGLLDLWNILTLLQADIMTKYSTRLQKCSTYLLTAKDNYSKLEIELIELKDKL